MLNKFFRSFLSNNKQNNKIIENSPKISNSFGSSSISDFFNRDQDFEVQKLKSILIETEKEVIRLAELVASKEKELGLQKKKLTSNEEELTGYINKIFEQQERERIVKWIVNSIRESLEVEKVVKTTVEEVGRLLKVDRCLMALYEESSDSFLLKNEYRLKDKISSIIEEDSEFIMPPEWHNKLVIEHKPVVVSDAEALSDNYKKLCFKSSDVKSFVAAPVVHKGKILGTIIVHQVNYLREWRNSHIDVLKYIGTQIAIAIQQARFYTDIKKRSDRESLLRTVISTVRSTLDINEVKKTVVTEIGKALNADRCFIRLYDTQKDKFMAIDSDSEYLSFPQIPSLTARRDNIRLINLLLNNIKNYQEFTIEDINEFIEEHYPNKDFKRDVYDVGFKSGIGIPIVFSERLIGVLGLHFVLEKRKIEKEEVELLKMLANQVGIAIHQLSLYERLQYKVKRETLLRKIITAIRSTLEIDEVLSILCAEVAKIFQVDRVVIAKMDNEIKKGWYIKKEHIVDENTKKVGKNTYCTEIGGYWWENYFKKGKKLRVDNIKNSNIPDYVKDYYEKMSTYSVLGLPIKRGDDSWGGLFLTTQSPLKILSNEDSDLLETITDQIYIAIRQADLFSKSEKTNHLKSEFLASMSHEFRTPLNAIIGFSDMLLQGSYGDLSEKQRDYLKNISKSGDHLLRLVNDVLDLSKVESGNMDLMYEKFDHRQITYEVASALESVASKKNIKIELKVSKGIIKADSKRFRQIMYNLISNAVKFTEENGKITVKSSIEGDNLRIEIKDTGIGIAKKDREKVFVQFAQLDSSYTRKQEGTGLGLALTKKFVELHNGHIDFSSIAGEGSRFWFVLPGVEV